MVLVILIVALVIWGTAEENQQYREDCLENGGKMIGDTCYMPDYREVEKERDGL